MKYEHWGYLIVIGLLALTLGAIATRTSTPVSGSVGDGSYQLTIPTDAVVYAGASLETAVVATNTARLSLEIENISTTTGQALFCAFNGNAAALNSGFMVVASSSKTIDNYRGAVHCKYQSATSAVIVIER